METKSNNVLIEAAKSNIAIYTKVRDFYVRMLSRDYVSENKKEKYALEISRINNKITELLTFIN